MIERERIGQHAREFFDALWGQGDPWDIETSELTARSHARLMALLDGRRYRRVLEIGCGAGAFTRRLATISDSVVALDIAPAAVERARGLNVGLAVVEFRVANVMESDLQAEGPWDLVVMAEDDLSPRLALSVQHCLARLRAIRSHGGGRMIIRTYHDLFRNVGHQVETEEVLRGIKDGVELEILISRLGKPVGAG